MTAVALILAALLFLAVAVATRERRHSRMCEAMNVSLTQQIRVEKAATAEQTRQAREAQAAVRALDLQTARLVERAEIAEVIAAQRKSEADGLRSARS